DDAKECAFSRSVPSHESDGVPSFHLEADAVEHPELTVGTRTKEVEGVLAHGGSPHARDQEALGHAADLDDGHRGLEIFGGARRIAPEDERPDHKHSRRLE